MKLLTEFWSVLEQLFEELLQQRDSCMFKARVNDNLKEYVVVVVVVKAKFKTLIQLIKYELLLLPSYRRNVIT
jgi:hypothetical protein